MKKNKIINEYIKKARQRVNTYVDNNKPFITYVITILINSLLLRILTMKSFDAVFTIKPLIADLAFILFVGSFVYLIKPNHHKKRFIYLLIVAFLLTLICIINSIYYTFYTSFSSISLIATSKFIVEVGDAVTQNVLQIKDLIYLWGPIVMIMTYYKLKKEGYYKDKKRLNSTKKMMVKTIYVALILAGLFIINLSSLEVGRFMKQWNREYIVKRFGIFTYHLNDAVKSLEPKLVTLFGYDTAKENFDQYFIDNPTIYKSNMYTNIFEGMNIIAIHAESIQTAAMEQVFNGLELTPNLNRLAREGIFFDHFYNQVSVGTSSDTEFTLNTSLMPSSIGTVFVNYFDREYISIPKLLQEKGYYAFSMHGNNGSFWNRNVMHKSLGYNKFYSKESFEIDDIVGLGLSDKSFFRQSINYILDIKEKHSPYYGTMIMLSNHTPFNDLDKYGNFAVDIKETVINPDGTSEVVTYPYMEETKLGNYFKSTHYADAAIGEFIQELDNNNLLENTVIIIYGDHDARLSKSNWNLLYNYDKDSDSVLDESDPNYIDFNSYSYELNRRTPFIIWTKERTFNRKVSSVMGAYDIAPTLGNMFNFKNPYALGKDIFNHLDDNIVVFPNSNWLTNTVYYNSQKGEYLTLTNSIISSDYIDNNIEYTEKLLEVSNNIINYNLLNFSKEK